MEARSLTLTILASALLAAAASPQYSIQKSPGPPLTELEPVARFPDRRPNVLLILCDQFNARMLGHEDNGWGGVSQSMTPRLDALAEEGVRFSNAVTVSAICQPSRYTILTGRWPFHHGVRTNSIWEPRGETTFTELAQTAGYKTGYFGQHHLFWFNQPPGWGDDHGFDEIIGHSDYFAYCAASGQSSYSLPANMWNMPGLPAVGEFEKTGFTTNQNAFHPAGYWASEVIRFLNDRAGPSGDGKPFALWYAPVGPHPPVLPSGVPPSDFAHLYHPFDQLALAPSLNKIPTTQRLASTQANFATVTDAQYREALSYYYGYITQIDHNIGRILDELESLELASDTLVVFTADHGEMGSAMSCWTKGAGSYDALTRVPLIMRLPGALPAGKTVNAPIINIDIFPTLVEATGMPMPDSLRATVDGVSLIKPMLAPKTPSWWRKENIHAFGSTKAGAKHHFMIRTPTVKYTLDELDGAEEFYDLVNDPHEIDDLFFDPNPGIQAQIAVLQNVLTQFWNNEIGHAPHYDLIGAWTAVPKPPTLPVPGNGAAGVSRDVDPGWLPCTGSQLQNVYVGTSIGNATLFATLQHMESSVNMGSLDPGTTYYWRVDQVNANGTAIGPVWSFTTTTGGTGGPPLTKSPVPAHLATNVPLGATLSWFVPPPVESQDVYFGVAGDLQLVAAGVPATTSTWDPGPLSAGVSYEWRIDGIDASGLTASDVWTFEVSSAGLPQRARKLAPAHFQAEVPTGTVLAWTAGQGAVSHDVYFGTSFPLAFQGNQTSTTWDPGALVSGQTYYWRIDEVNAAGTTMGWTVRFSR